MASQITPVDLQSLLASVTAKHLAVASFVLIMYDYLLTLDEEIKYFWRGRWNITRALFLINRYFPPCSLLLGLVAFFLPESTITFCDRTVRACFIMNIISMAIIQAILVLRIYYLFAKQKLIQAIAIAGIILCTGATAAILARFLEGFHSISNPFASLGLTGCGAPPPVNYWPVFLPAFILHSLLYLLTAYRALKSMQSLNNTPLLRQLLRDGGMFYIVVLFSVGYTEIGSFMTAVPMANIPAVYSSFTVAINSVCISRVLLSIHSLAAQLDLDPIWLLNNAELSRVHWKQGATEGEIIVEIDAVEGVDLELNRIEVCSPLGRSPSKRAYYDSTDIPYK